MRPSRLDVQIAFFLIGDLRLPVDLLAFTRRLVVVAPSDRPGVLDQLLGLVQLVLKLARDDGLLLWRLLVRCRSVLVVPRTIGDGLHFIVGCDDDQISIHLLGNTLLGPLALAAPDLITHRIYLGSGDEKLVI